MAVNQEIKGILKMPHTKMVSSENFLGVIWILIHVKEPEKIRAFCSIYLFVSLCISGLQTLMASRCKESSFHTSCWLKISFLVHF